MNKMYTFLLTMVVLSSPMLTTADTDEIGAVLTSHTMYVSGTTMDLEFTIQWTSPDAEWYRGMEMDFPIGMTPNSATPVGGVGAVIVGQNVDWLSGSVNSSSGSETFTVNVSIDGGLSGDQIADFFVEGDGWGAPPHNFNGSTTIVQIPAMPLSNWAFVLIGILALSMVVFKFRK